MLLVTPGLVGGKGPTSTSRLFPSGLVQLVSGFLRRASNNGRDVRTAAEADVDELLTEDMVLHRNFASSLCIVSP